MVHEDEVLRGEITMTDWLISYWLLKNFGIQLSVWQYLLASLAGMAAIVAAFFGIVRKLMK